MRVSLGADDVDCRPYYSADPGDWIVKALVAAEDGEFWHHHGVRPLSIMRALAQNIVFRRRVSGASTISMQCVRLLKPHRKSYLAKWIEAVQAVKMEKRRDKLWILTQYLNRAPFGANFIGIESAAQGWFGKSAKELGLGEAAILAGMVQAPSFYRPDRHYDRALRRREYVLSRMVKLGMITEEERAAAAEVKPELRRAKRPFEHPYYCDWYLGEIKSLDHDAQRLYGDFTTPLDADIQAIAEEAVKSVGRSAYETAAVVVRVKTGEVVAMAVSGDYFGDDAGQVNTAAAPRPAGSTLKPFLTAQAMDLGIVGSSSTLLDVPMAVEGYNPVNFDGSYRGEVSLADALVLSLNVPFVRLCREVGVERFASKLNEFGFRHVVEPYDRYGLGLAIGNAEVTLVELTSAYARLARGEGVSREAAYLVADMLSGSERSSAALGHVAAVKLPRFAWKTGTSSAYRDAWTVAWNPEYAVGVWCGHLSGGFGDERLVGAKVAAPVAWKIARAIYPSGEGPWFRRPDGCGALEKRRLPPAAAAVPFAIVKPANGSEFKLVESAARQQLVCRVTGNPEGEKLWWFLDGAPVGETAGSEPLVLDLVPGRHRLSAVTADGTAAESSFTVTAAESSFTVIAPMQSAIPSPAPFSP